MIGVAILFIIFGILIKYGKMYWLIAGYNTIPKEQKDKYNIGGIANVFRNVMFGMAFIIFSGYLIAKWKDNSNIQNYAFGISILIGIPYLLLESNSKKYKKIKKKQIELLNKIRTNNNKNDTTTRAISTCYFPTTYENPRGFSILSFFLDNLFLNSRKN